MYIFGTIGFAIFCLDIYFGPGVPDSSNLHFSYTSTVDPRTYPCLIAGGDLTNMQSSSPYIFSFSILATKVGSKEKQD